MFSPRDVVASTEEDGAEDLQPRQHEVRESRRRAPDCCREGRGHILLRRSIQGANRTRCEKYQGFSSLRTDADPHNPATLQKYKGFQGLNTNSDPLQTWTGKYRVGKAKP